MLWGGRFDSEFDKQALAFSSSLHEDINLLHEEVKCSKAYAEMLHKIGIINEEELKTLLHSLLIIDFEWFERKWVPDPAQYEDVHTAIETRLYELCGPVAGKLRAGRSRNDQVVTSLRLWMKQSSTGFIKLLKELQVILVALAAQHSDTVIPGYTHLQQAQPVSLAHHLLAYVQMLERDKKHFQTVYEACDISPLGAGALAGSTLPLDTMFLKERLGFADINHNSLDAVSDRDFVLDFLHACSVGMMHLSRFCEEIIIWSSNEWSLLIIGDAFTTGSSLMPQKKNPDMAELIRGKAGRVISNYQAVATMMKGLPLSYNRDMQEDKVSVFNSYAAYTSSLQVLTGMAQTFTFDNSYVAEKMENSAMMATDIADALVLKGVPFREAHDIVGKLVKLAINTKKPFNRLSLEEMQSVHAAFDASFPELLQITGSLERKKTIGSPNPFFVKAQIAKWQETLGGSNE
ncbi:MAG: argininosuccinate lyase [Ignavibacteriales bacterium]|nr:argininosuccinate lyase [Ignavibacteriales bacterium]